MVVSIFELLVSFHLLAFSVINLFLFVNLKFCRQSLIEIQSFSRRFLYHFENTVFCLHRTTVKSRFKILAGQKSKCCESISGDSYAKVARRFIFSEKLKLSDKLLCSIRNYSIFSIFKYMDCVGEFSQKASSQLFDWLLNGPLGQWSCFQCSVHRYEFTVSIES